MDTVGGGGVSVNFGSVDPLPIRGIRVLPVRIRADGAALAGLSSSAGDGRLTPRVAGTYPLEQAAEAFLRQAKGGLRGRLVRVP